MARPRDRVPSSSRSSATRRSTCTTRGTGRRTPTSSSHGTATRNVARNRRISTWAEGQLRALAAPDHFPAGLDDLAFVVQGTTADLRFLDGTIDPSDRVVGTSLWGPPTIANYLPAGIGRCSTLRSWLNQWSLDHALGDALRWLPEIEAPVMVMVGTADPVVVPQMAQQMYDKATRAPRELVVVPGATHYFEQQPDLLDDALDTLVEWLP